MKTIRVGICTLVVFAVLSFGAVQAWSQALLEIGAGVLFLAWAFIQLRQKRLEVHGNWIYGPLLGLGALGLTQYLFGLSADPYATKIALFRWACYFLLAFLAVESFRTVKHRKSFAWFLICFCFLISLFALVQHFATNGKIYWLVSLPGGAIPFGPFVNHNHFAGFVELAGPFGLSLLFSGSYRSEKSILLGLFATLPVVALLVSASRGGITSFLAETLLLAWILRREIAARGRVALIGFLLITAILALWLGMGITVERFASLESEQLSRDMRVTMYKNTWRIFKEHRLTGTGAGTLQTVYPRYESVYQPNVVDHAHDDYLELLAETGLVGGIFAFSFIILLFWRGMANFRAGKSSLEKSLVAAALAGCAGLLCHSFVDFNLHIPSNALLFLLLAALATSSASA